MAWPHVEKVPHPTPFSTWHFQASPVSSENPKQPETFPNSQGKIADVIWQNMMNVVQNKGNRMVKLRC